MGTTAKGTARILVVDDQPPVATLVAAALERAGYETAQANAYTEGARILESERWDLVVSDLSLDEGKTGIDLLRESRGRSPEVPFILMTGQADLDSSVEALQTGAVDYLSKPIDMERLVATVQRALTESATASRPKPASSADAVPRLVGRTAAMVEVYKGIARAAATDSPVLIVGDEGVGKDLVAREIHRRSARRGDPFRVLDCGDLTTGEFARRVRPHDGGTLLLKNVHELPPPLQRSLASLLGAACETRLLATVRGGSDAVAALQRPLACALSVLQIRVPALGARVGDIALLAGELLRCIEPRAGKALRATLEAVRFIEERTWPGNVRELAATLEAAAVASRSGEIGPEDVRRALAAREPVDAADDVRPLTFCPGCGKTYSSGSPDRAVGACGPCAERERRCSAGAGADAMQATAGSPRFRGNRYLPYRVLSRGESTEVWVAWQPALSRRVVLKILRASGADDIERFKREARIHASLRHRGIPAVYEAGVDETNPNQLYIVMELIEGVPLDTYARALAARHDDAAGLRTLARLMADAAGVLAHLHERGLVHRDIKPQNILVTPDERVFLIDYGLTRPATADDMLTVTGVVQGTIPFMAPEQTTGERNAVDARTDVWGLGATFYYLATGRYPFGSGEFAEVTRRLQSAAPRPPCELNPLLSPGIGSILLRAIEKRPDDRYADARGFEEALRAELHQQVTP